MPAATGLHVAGVLDEFMVDVGVLLVKTLETLEIVTMGGRTIAQRQRMFDVEVPEEWTEVSVNSVEYDIEISDSLFTLSNLRNPRD